MGYNAPNSLVPAELARSMNDVTNILSAIEQGSPHAAERLRRWSMTNRAGSPSRRWRPSGLVGATIQWAGKP